MIRKNTINCKLYLIKNLKKSGYPIISDGISCISLKDEVCPTCGLKGGCSPHASYKRYLFDFNDGQKELRQLTVPRVICSCGATHAILPDPIIPYLQYSLFYILMVLAVYSCHVMTVEKICETYLITPSMLYRWISIYKDHRTEWQGVLESTSMDIMHSLYKLCQKKPFSSFAIAFIRTTGLSFLQSHKNPANCRRNFQYTFLPEAIHTTREFT